MTSSASPPSFRPPTGRPAPRFRRATTPARGSAGRIVVLGTLVAALAAVGRALWLRGAARRFARVRGPRFAAAVEAPRAALPAGPAAPASDPGAPASASPEPGAPGGEGPA